VSEYKCKDTKFFAEIQGFPPENAVFYKEKSSKMHKKFNGRFHGRDDGRDDVRDMALFCFVIA
jgi:hypothetical protein